MKRSVRLLFVSAVCMCTGFLAAQEHTANLSNEIMFADPTVFVENGRYYLTGTRNREPLGFSVLESTDLKEWKSPDGLPQQLILEKGQGAYGDKGFWAPQYYKEGDVYYFTYTANEQTVLAYANSVYGPFKQNVIRPVDESAKNIDSFLFKDSDGKYYFYHVRFNNGNFLWVAEFDLASGTIKPETLTQCFENTQAWEATPNYQSAPIMEGPTVIKLDDVYYLFYSANHFQNIDYAVGYATSGSPYGPWVKYAGNPIIHRDIVGENGSGHGDLFEGLDGSYYYVYHVHHSDSQVAPRKTRIVPMIFEKNPATGLYDISVDSSAIIVPTTR